MDGAESLIRTAASAGLDICFANPGTTEIPLVAALDKVPGMRAILGLHENVVTGAADGYARMAGKPALTLLHLGPGFANGIANLHNARRGRSPVVNMIGDQATWHDTPDAPLTADVDGLSKAISHWVRRSTTADGMPGDMAEALGAAAVGGGQIATLILPHDLQMAETTSTVAGAYDVSRPAVAGDQVDAAAVAVRKDGCGLMLCSEAMTVEGLQAAGRIHQATGVALLAERPMPRAERGGGLPAPAPIPYFPERAMEALAPYQTIVFAGAKDPVSFFGWDGFPSYMAPEGCEKVRLGSHGDDVVGALEALADALGAPAYKAVDHGPRPDRPTGALTAETVCQAIAALQPEDTIVVDEAVTSGWSYPAQSISAPRFSQISLTGGAIGDGPPLATGAALACPDRQVIGLQADGSGLYTVQALWTQAKEELNVVTVVCANRKYRILQVELQRAGLNQPGEQAERLTDFGSPAISWVDLAKGFGVPAVSVEDSESLTNALERALAEPGPQVIEALIA